MKNSERKSSFAGLYIEGLRQTRKMTLIFSVIGAMLSFLTLALRAMNMSPETSVVKVVAAGEQLGFLVMSFMAAAPLMTLSLFSFLNRRPSCDFYHSVPCTRTALFLSQTAALVTHFAVILCSCGGAFLLALLFNRRFFVLLPGSLAATLGGCFSGMLLVSAAITIAIGLTGTLFNNVVVSGFIIFVPRVLIYFFTHYISASLPMTVQNRLFALADMRLNIPAAATAYINSPESILTNPVSMLYTFVLALAYFAAALFIFRRRRSEAAGSGASSRKMQGVYRILIGFAASAGFTIMLASMIVQENRGNYYSRSNTDVLGVLAGYLFSAVLFFVYEIITTKSWKKLLRAFPSLGIVVALNMLLGLLFAGVCSFEANWAPEPGRVKEVYVLADERYGSYGIEDGSIYDLAMLNGEKVPLTDPELCRAVSEALSRDVKDFKDGTYYNGSDRPLYASENLTPADRRNANGFVWTETVTLKVNTGFGSKVRQIRADDALLALISEKTNQSEAFRERVTDVPELIKASGVAFYNSEKMMERLSLGDGASDRVGEIWNVLRDEVKSFTSEEAFLLSGKASTASGSCFVLTGQVAFRFRSIRVSAIVDKELTPRTYQALKEAIKASHERQKPLADALGKLLEDPENKKIRGSAYVTMYDEDGVGYHAYWDLNEGAKKLYAALNELCPGLVLWDGEGDPVIVYLSLSLPESSTVTEGSLFLIPCTNDPETVAGLLEEY